MKAVLLSHIIFEDYCTVDIDASDHITDLQTFFSSYESYGANMKICVANSSISKVAGVGSVHLSNMML